MQYPQRTKSISSVRVLERGFRGELVPQDPSEEPASALLERIRAQRPQQAASAKQRSKAPQRSKTGKQWSTMEPEQLTLAEVLTARSKLLVPEQCMTEASYDASLDSQLPSQ